VKKASISEAKNNLSALIDRVKAGASVLIVDRGRPVARLEPVNGNEDERMVRLVRDGVVSPARAVPASSPWATSAPPTPRAGASALQALLDERRDDR
jgi:prevent-host-death family protein